MGWEVEEAVSVGFHMSETVVEISRGAQRSFCLAFRFC
jgi:hypothetical protein